MTPLLFFHIDLNPDSFMEDFSDGQAQYWTTVHGPAEWAIVDGVYIGTQGSNDFWSGYYNAGSAKFYGNFSFEADAKRVEGFYYVLGLYYLV